MDQVFDDMMRSMQANPAGGFQDFLATQERRALAEIQPTPEEERRIGRRMRDEYLRRADAEGYKVVTDGARLRYLRDLVEANAPRMAHRRRYPDLDLALIDAPVADGQSFPGGFLVFTTALLDEPDEATVAGVVAHELAHLDLGHLYSMAQRAKLAEGGFAPDPSMMADPGRMMTRGMAIGGLMMMPFRPEQELEADCAATTWLYLGGYDPRALAGFFERLHARNRDQPDNPFFRFNRSHPYSLDRRAEVLDRLAQLRRWKDRADLGLFAENLQELVSRPREEGRARDR
jgi:predicted Zn-dependent protease